MASMRDVTDDDQEEEAKGEATEDPTYVTYVTYFAAIVAYDDARGIGRDGTIPWHEPEDLRFFSRATRGGVVVYGRRTYDSLPPAYRPLPGRHNVVLSSTASARRSRDRESSAAAAAAGAAAGADADAEADATPPSLGRRVHWVGDVDEAVAVARRLARSPRGPPRGPARGPARGQPAATGATGAAAPPLRLFVAGGERVYRAFLRRGLVDTVLATRVAGDHGCDRSFPEIGTRFTLERSDPCPTNPRLRFETHRARPNAGEAAYLALVRRALGPAGVRRRDRTGVGTRSLFGETLRFDLSGGAVPVLTTKRVFWRGVVEELLWFLRGDTHAGRLSARGVRIWDANGSRAFLDGRGLGHHPEGVLGPVYGWQWRRFGAPYDPAAVVAGGPGGPGGAAGAGGTERYADQVRRVVELLRADPSTRRAVLSAWNPNQLAEMALPPCHVLYHFWVSSGRRLHCAVYQRSGDLGLGVPFNVASAALLTHLVARATGTVARELVHVVGDAHVYETHVAPLRRQLRRVPRSFPTVEIAPGAPRDRPWDTRADQIRLVGYDPCAPAIRMPMAV